MTSLNISVLKLFVSLTPTTVFVVGWWCLLLLSRRVVPMGGDVVRLLAEPLGLRTIQSLSVPVPFPLTLLPLPLDLLSSVAVVVTCTSVVIRF